jgi:hypothetical protein
MSGILPYIQIEAKSIKQYIMKIRGDTKAGGRHEKKEAI